MERARERIVQRLVQLLIMEQFLGIVPCAVMSMMSNALGPSACETDILQPGQPEEISPEDLAKLHHRYTHEYGQ